MLNLRGDLIALAALAFMAAIVLRSSYSRLGRSLARPGQNDNGRFDAFRFAP